MFKYLYRFWLWLTVTSEKTNKRLIEKFCEENKKYLHGLPKNPTGRLHLATKNGAVVDCVIDAYIASSVNPTYVPQALTNAQHHINLLNDQKVCK